MPTRTKSILVVEDHAIFRRFLLSWLSRSYNVVALSDGFEALRWLQEGNTPDLVVLDMEMPRITGVQFLRNIRSSGMFRDLPVVGLSSSVTPALTQRCAQLGVTDLFAKPYKPQDLRAAIERALLPLQLPLAA